MNAVHSRPSFSHEHHESVAVAFRRRPLAETLHHIVPHHNLFNIVSSYARWLTVNNAMVTHLPWMYNNQQ